MTIMQSGGGTPVAGMNEGLTTHWLEYNVLNWKDPVINIFRELVVDGLSEYLKIVCRKEQETEVAGISCWANVLRFGEGIQVHHHDPAFVSAHYTVRAGFEDGEVVMKDSGSTLYFRPGFFERSHGGEAHPFGSPWDEDWVIRVQPKEGTLFFFPSFLRHEVRPYLGGAQRISIALDVFLKSQKLPMYFGSPRWFVPARL
jgi:hypothetical protein